MSAVELQSFWTLSKGEQGEWTVLHAKAIWDLGWFYQTITMLPQSNAERKQQSNREVDANWFYRQLKQNSPIFDNQPLICFS